MPDFTDIDADHKNPQLCSHYVHDIYRNLRASEVRVLDTSLFFVVYVQLHEVENLFQTSKSLKYDLGRFLDVYMITMYTLHKHYTQAT